MNTTLRVLEYRLTRTHIHIFLQLQPFSRDTVSLCLFTNALTCAHCIGRKREVKRRSDIREGICVPLCSLCLTGAGEQKTFTSPSAADSWISPRGCTEWELRSGPIWGTRREDRKRRSQVCFYRSLLFFFSITLLFTQVFCVLSMLMLKIFFFNKKH